MPTATEPSAIVPTATELTTSDVVVAGAVPSARAHTRTHIAVERVTRELGGGRVHVEHDASGDEGFPVIRPVLVASDDSSARIQLVPEAALLLDGDAVRISVRVGGGVTLHLGEPAGTVAYDMRGGAARWEVDIELAPGAQLRWRGEPFVAAAGSRTAWTTRVRLGEGAGLMLREIVVLGRHGEVPGQLNHEVHVHVDDGTPLLVDGLAVGPGTGGVLLGGNRVIASTLLFGPDAAGADAPTPHCGTRFELEGGGVLLRGLARELHELG